MSRWSILWTALLTTTAAWTGTSVQAQQPYPQPGVGGPSYAGPTQDVNFGPGTQFAGGPYGGMAPNGYGASPAGFQMGMEAGMQFGSGPQQLPRGTYGTPYAEYARTWRGQYVQPTNPQAPPGVYPTHQFDLRYHAPRNLVYPQQNQPAGVVAYPYYTVRGPTDFFMNDENLLNR